MKRFDHMGALLQLINIDTAIFKEELYYPWYVKKSGIKAISIGWSSLMILITAVFSLFTSSTIISILMIVSAITLIFSLLFIGILKHQEDKSKAEALKQMITLERREFMRGIQPFVSPDQQLIVKRIIEDKKFTPQEYTSVTLATQSKILFDTDSFIKDVEDMFKDTEVETLIRSKTRNNSYSDSTFKVPDKAKKNYQEMKENQGAFSDAFSVPPEAKQAIIKRVQEAATKNSTLGQANKI